jgi:threonine synthase
MAPDLHPATGSTLTHLEGSASRARYDADELHRLDPTDGRPLLARYDIDRALSVLTPEILAGRRSGGMWRYAEILPVREWRHVTTLGEGSTPLLAAPRLGEALGLAHLSVKLDGLNPTGAFKARGMAAAVSRAVELGATSFIVPSAGNAAGALAAYGAAAGAPVTVVMPSDVPEANVTEATVAGAQIVLVDGLINDCGRIAAQIAEVTGAFDVSTLKEPYRLEGKKTMGLELAEDLGWILPDVVVYPTGGGTGLVGMWKAFTELEELGFIGSSRPRMVAVQSTGCAPIVRAFDAGAEHATPWEGAETRAGGIRVPSAVGDALILTALRESGGTAVAVDEGSIDEAQLLAGRRGLGYVSPESAAALAGAADVRARGEIDATDHVIVFDTGIGAKYPPPPGLPRPPVVDPDDVDVEALLARLSGGD